MHSVSPQDENRLRHATEEGGSLMREEAKVPDKVRGNSISLIGLTAALNDCRTAVESNLELTESATWAGVITVKGRRAADVGVFVRVRPKEDE